ncbi:universal stress protein [Rhodococcus phenolicus]|uniref:universal stress protein n=1 Tax=Rhodococcus phenolicus TaxID=263849 RepID=UPI0008365F8D|nr:universal stress protein [Rhodococcus phenolicus]
MSTASTRRGIVAGIDGSDSALGAARWAASVAQRFGEPLHLLHVQANGRSGDGTADELLDAAETSVRDGPGGVEIERSVEHGTPQKVLVERSGTARMIVLGHLTTSEMQSMFRGSDVVYTSNHAKCPVVSWRGKPAPEAVNGRPVVVGVDGSELSTRAIEHAFEFASFIGAPLIAVHSWTEQSTLTYGEGSRFIEWDDYVKQQTALVSESLAGWQSRYPDVEVSHSVERGKPEEALLEHSSRSQLVVVGSHGRSPMTAAVLGSTSQSLLHHALCPVLIARGD